MVMKQGIFYYQLCQKCLYSCRMCFLPPVLVNKYEIKPSFNLFTYL